MKLPPNIKLITTKTVTFKITKVTDAKEQIVEGEVYAPYVIDSHGDMMLPEDVKQMCHLWSTMRNSNKIDLMHDNVLVDAHTVESYIAKAHDPEYREGAWVMATKINDAHIWGLIEQGVYSGYSFEAKVFIEDAVIEYDLIKHHFGFTTENDGHDHTFFVEVDEMGKVIGGQTSEDDDHFHLIKAGTATQRKDGHSHRFFLKDVEES